MQNGNTPWILRLNFETEESAYATFEEVLQKELGVIQKRSTLRFGTENDLHVTKGT